MIELRAIGEENRAAVLALTVREEQRTFVVTNAESLKEAEGKDCFFPLAIYEGDRPVGFAMYVTRDAEDGQCWIYRLMVDASCQGRGYGRAAMALLLRRIAAQAPGRDLFIAFEPENAAARALYSSFGFRPDNWMGGGEEVWCLRQRPLDLREATAADYPALADLSAQWAAEDLTWSFSADRAEYFADKRCWVARGEDGAVLGYLAGYMAEAPKMTGILPEGTPYFELDEVYVRPDARNAGVGGRLFLHLRQVLKAERKNKAILLSAANKDYEPLLRFYIQQMGMTFWSARLFMKL